MSTLDKHDFSGFIGKHLVYTYDSDWSYETYVKDGHTPSYRIHSGIVGNRWVKDQEAYVVRMGEGIYKISRTEPTDTDISLIANLDDGLFHGTIFFPRWVMNNPEKTAYFQNDHVPLMSSYRDAGSTCPIEVIDGLATITFIRDCGADNDEVINYPANELPADFPADL